MGQTKHSMNDEPAHKTNRHANWSIQRRLALSMKPLLATMVLVWASWCWPAKAQVDLLGGGDGGSAQDGPGAGGTGADLLNQEIQVELTSFGIGGVARPGEWCGVQLTVIEQTQLRREVIIRMSLQDSDGDSAEYRTVLSTNPGVRQPVTLYVRLPASFTGDMPPTVSVYAAEEAEDAGGPGALGYREGALISQTRLSQNQVFGTVLGQGQGAMLLVGSRTLGLEAYQQSFQNNEGYLPFGHEVTRLAQGLTPSNLPDRWHGLAPFAEIVWSEGSPGDLGLEQARALREWVQRGGHLVIVLPVVGNEWISLQNPEIVSLLPRVTIERREAQPIEPYRPLLVATPDVVLRRPLTVHALDPLAQAEPQEAMRIINGPDGRCIVARRLVGLGAVTVIGLDLLGIMPRRGTLDAGNFVPPDSVSPGLPEADVFWHRVLGRRGSLMSTAGTTAWEANPTSPKLSGRSVSWIDSDIGDRINRTGRAAQGVLLALVVFALYWIVAGPGGFFALRRKGAERHAWTGFVLAGLLFTGIAWGGAWAIKPKTMTFDHLTVLDHVYGQRLQRARTIGSLLVPDYGEASLEVGTDEERAVAGRGRFTHLAAPWEPIDGVRRSGVGFPDSRGYAIDSRAPSLLTFPTRATVKQVEMDWLGGMGWSGIRPVAAADEEVGRVVQVAEQGSSILSGVLTHDLPGPLSNVTIFVVQGMSNLATPPRSGQGFNEPSTAMYTIGRAYKIGSDWQPGDPLNLAALTNLGPALSLAERSTLIRTMQNLLPNPSRTLVDLTMRPTYGSLDDRIVSMSFFNQLHPPVYSINSAVQPTLARRAVSHTMDLSRWFTQPCVIVIGQLRLEGPQSIPTPFEVRVNDQLRAPSVRGTTVVRWIYPLDDAPPAYPASGNDPQLESELGLDPVPEAGMNQFPSDDDGEG